MKHKEIPLMHKAKYKIHIINLSSLFNEIIQVPKIGILQTPN